MLSIADVARILRGTGWVLRLDPRGIAAFDGSAADATRSFLAAVVLLPVFLLYLVFERVQGSADPQAPALVFLSVKLLQYVTSWTLFPVVMEVISRLLDRRIFYFRWLAAYNWVQVPIMMAFLPIAILAGLGLIQAEGLALFNSLTFMALAFYLGFLARHGLQLPVLSAIGVVFLDLILGEVLHTATLVLLHQAAQSAGA